MNFKPKKIWVIIGIILLLFIVTNPAIKRFKDYRGETSYKGLKRKANFGIFSIYQDGQNRYIGILLNFFKTGEYEGYYSHGHFIEESYTPSTADIKPPFDPNKPYEAVYDTAPALPKGFIPDREQTKYDEYGVPIIRKDTIQFDEEGYPIPSSIKAKKQKDPLEILNKK